MTREVAPRGPTQPKRPREEGNREGAWCSQEQYLASRTSPTAAYAQGAGMAAQLARSRFAYRGEENRPEVLAR